MEMIWKLGFAPFGAQKTAVEKALNRRGWGHFLEQGLGKTAVIFNEWLLYRDQGEVSALVVIAPNSLLGNWKAEAEKFGISDEIVVWNSGRGKSIASEVERLLRMSKLPFIFVINYEAVASSGGKVIDQILSERRVFMVADESISLKNPNGQRSKEVREMAKSARMVRALSGAPVSQGVHDLWAQLRFIGELEGTNFFAFRNRYCVMGGWKGKQVIRPRSDTAEELTRLLAKCSFRAEKKDWTDIPEKLYTTRNISMPAAQREAYKSMTDDFMVLLENSDVTADLVITKLMKLQQISTGFVMDDQNQTHWLVPDEENPKLRMLKETMEETNNKVIVFTFHRAAVDLLRRSLPAEETAYLVGEMTREQIEAEKARFNLADGVKTMVCQINAAMYGHTLLGTADRPCHTTVFFENNYSLNARVQAEDRNHRHGQKNNVLYVDLITSEMDEMVIEALKKKQNVATTLMEKLKKVKSK